MFPVSSIANKKKPAAAKGPEVKINENQSKDIMNELFNELDQKDAEELGAARGNNAVSKVAFSKEEEMENKYGAYAATDQAALKN